MKKKIEKSIEQIALENYVWKTGTKKFLKESKWTAFIVACIAYILSVIFLAYDSFFWNSGTSGIFACLFFCLIPAGMVFAITLVSYGFFVDLYRGKRKTRKFIANLSQEEKKKITKDYLNSEIQKWKKDITYCENQIKPYQKLIQHHGKEIERLELELSKFN
ncbi:hypothetical protein K9M48_05490 [Candidatus Gracilibacteria bacterium]|nr:hypothetical protein [Candidatus Gracilibacteria bacterium]